MFSYVLYVSGVWGGVRKDKRAASQAAMRQQSTNTGWLAAHIYFLSEMLQEHSEIYPFFSKFFPFLRIALPIYICLFLLTF